MKCELIQLWMYSLLFGSMALLIIGSHYYALFIGAVLGAIAIGVTPIENSFYFVWGILVLDPSVYLFLGENNAHNYFRVGD